MTDPLTRLADTLRAEIDTLEDDATFLRSRIDTLREVLAKIDEIAASTLAAEAPATPEGDGPPSVRRSVQGAILAVLDAEPGGATLDMLRKWAAGHLIGGLHDSECRRAVNGLIKRGLVVTVGGCYFKAGDRDSGAPAEQQEAAQ